MGLADAHMVILSFPPVSDALMGSLEMRSRAAEARRRLLLRAIVVLGGGIGAAHPPEQP